MLLIIGKGIRGGICHVIHQYATANNKYMKERNKDNQLSYIMYLDSNNLYEWAISQKVPVDTHSGKLRLKDVLRTAPKDVLWTSPYDPL